MPQEVHPQIYAHLALGRFTHREIGLYTFGLISAGRSRLFIDGREVIENWTEQTRGGDFFMSGAEAQATVTLEAGRAYLLTLEYTRSEAAHVAFVRLGCLPPVPADAIARATALAAASDVAIVCVGFGGD